MVRKSATNYTINYVAEHLDILHSEGLKLTLILKVLVFFLFFWIWWWSCIGNGANPSSLPTNKPDMEN